MGLTRYAPTRRVTGKFTLKANGGAAKSKKRFTLHHAPALLPGLHRHSQGSEFGPQIWRSWLQHRLDPKAYHLPGSAEASRILRTISRKHKGTHGTWRSHGVKYVDVNGSSAVRNIEGFEHKVGPSGSKVFTWHEHGYVYRLRRSTKGSREVYKVTRAAAFKRLSCAVERRNLEVALEDGKASFPGSVVMNPRKSPLGDSKPRWTLIYLHSFSNKGTDYMEFPHYFSVSGAALRVVLPTAPMIEQHCFKDWNVWKGERLQWRRIKFNAWFDYLTDKCGAAENDICIKSLISMRDKLHAIIRHEVQRVGGDPKRVIVGGASQGCCVALDAAMTYPDDLGGVIGLVGHLLGSTPLDYSKREMPIHLFHEACDKEMRWGWVEKTVNRLVDEGFNVTSKRETDPTGSGHWIQDIEGIWIRRALKQIVGGRCSKA